MLLSIIAAVGVLALLIVVHEMGHFLAAKRAGVRVLRFSIGYPPKIFGIRLGQTEYMLSATPFGGYVRMLGDEVGEELSPSDIRTYLSELLKDIVTKASGGGHGGPEQRKGWSKSAASASVELAKTLLSGKAHLRTEERLLLEEIVRQGSIEAALDSLSLTPAPELLDAVRQEAFPTQPLRKRVAIVLAGPLANILFVPVILTAVFAYGIPVLLPVVGEVKPGLPAEQAGLRPGDRIVAVNQQKIATWDELSRAVRSSGGRPLLIEYERAEGGTTLKLSATVRPVRDTAKGLASSNAGIWMIGVLPRGDSTVKRFGPVSAAVQGVLESARMAGTLILGLARIFTGATPLRETLGGPIMIARLAGEQAHQGLANLGLFMAMLSLELGVINLFPIPMLDGGHLLFFLIEGVRGRPLQVRHRELAQQVGLFLLMALMAFVIFNDLTRLAQG